MRLKNRKIIVTAAAQGIGKAVALAFAREGAEVLATDVNSEKIQDLDNINQNLSTSVLDATNKESVEKFCETINEVDILFHAVGFVHHGTILECDSEEFYNSININIYSA